MIPSVPVPLRALAMASLIALSLTACGRRGPLEAPPDPIAAAAQRQREEIRRQRQGGPAAANPTGAAVAGQTEIPPVAEARRSEGAPPVPDEDDADELPSNIAPTPIPTRTPSGGRKRGVTVPNEPFILDPLL